MKITAKMLNEVCVFNEHDLLLRGEPCITYRRYESRSCLPNGWFLWIKGRKIKGPWYEHGGMTFSGFGSTEDPLESARHACRRLLGHPTVWVKSPLGNRGKYPTWIPAEALERAEALVKAGPKKT